MPTVLTIALGLLALALLSMRPPTVDDRTPAELRATIRRAGARRALLTTLRIALVVALLLLVEACRISYQAAAAAAVLLGVLAAGIEALSRTSVAGRAA